MNVLCKQSDVSTFAREYDSDPGSASAWDSLQSTYVCCGGFDRNEGFNFWKDHMKHDSVPDSCCLEENQGCGRKVLSFQIDAHRTDK